MYVIFTDLDGTLLDFDTYSFERAREVLTYIRKKKIPLVAVTSKTAAEVQQIIKAMDICHPFVVENGGGIFFPETYQGEFPRTQMEDGYYIVPFMQAGIKPLDVLDAISSKIGIQLRGFSHLTVEEVVSFTGLSIEEARKAQQRHFSEPFILPPHKSDFQKIIRLSHSYNYKIVLGGRFAHLIPEDSGKGNAVKFLISFYQKLFSGVPLISIGLGDSPNDFDFLSITDISILIRSKGQIPKFAGKKWIKSQKPGVEGWAEEVKKIIFP
jgi:mannosyl-3-phosphoglycerate phosphatase